MQNIRKRRLDQHFLKELRQLFSTHLEFASQILDVAGQRPFGPWPPPAYQHECTSRESIHADIRKVLNKYRKGEKNEEGI